ncbi:glycosyltransferase [Fontimonas sp. SYSU GA230001]|uniref:glycosyltransferase n=1 Tax=Fontimonas sp. SYSU GA230001 TaxID=3142450 RepID=UPI0032B41DA4
MSALRSLQIIGSQTMGGAENSFVRLVRALTRAGMPADAVTRSGSDVRAALDGHRQCFEVPMRNALDLSSVLRIRRLLREGAYPVVQTWATRATWLTRAPSGVVHVARLGGYYRPRNFRHADAWVVNTRGLRDWLVGGGFPADRVHWIDNFVPIDARPPPMSRRDLGIPDDALVTVALGRLVPKKGFQDLLAAMAALPQQIAGRTHHLILMGEGRSRAALEAQARDAGLQARVHFTGWLDTSVAALALGDLMICPSREEPLGNVILEAWSKRLPVLSTRSAGGMELIEEGVTGLLCAVADPAGLAERWRRLLEEPGLRLELAQRGSEHFEKRYSEAATVAAYRALYGKLVGDSDRVRVPSTSR